MQYVFRSNGKLYAANKGQVVKLAARALGNRELRIYLLAKEIKTTTKSVIDIDTMSREDWQRLFDAVY